MFKRLSLISFKCIRENHPFSPSPTAIGHELFGEKYVCTSHVSELVHISTSGAAHVVSKWITLIDENIICLHSEYFWLISHWVSWICFVTVNSECNQSMTEEKQPIFTFSHEHSWKHPHAVHKSLSSKVIQVLLICFLFRQRFRSLQSKCENYSGM